MTSADLEIAGEAPASGAGEALDRACERILEAAAGRLRVEVAGTEAEREACYRLRYRCAIEEGWADPAELPDGMERDPYDDEAVHICAWHGSELAGTVRLVFPRPGLTLPIERDFGVELRPPGKVVDGGRLVVAQRYRASLGYRVLATLFSRCWLIARERGLSWFASVAPDRVIKLYRRSGLIVEVIGEPREFWGAERHPFLLTIIGADPERFFKGAR